MDSSHLKSAIEVIRERNHRLRKNERWYHLCAALGLIFIAVAFYMASVTAADIRAQSVALNKLAVSDDSAEALLRIVDLKLSFLVAEMKIQGSLLPAFGGFAAAAGVILPIQNKRKIRENQIFIEAIESIYVGKHGAE